MEKMQWYNEPEKWHVINDSSLSMHVTPNTDFWRETHYGFTTDNGPFYYCLQDGGFELEAKITGDYKTLYDQMGLMIRKDEKIWIKTGVEYVNGKINLSAVVTLEKSDWSMIELKENPKSIWLKVIRSGDCVEIKYSLDSEHFTMMRLAYFPDKNPIMIGLTAASPKGDGFNALFEDFKVKPLPELK